MRFTLSVNAWIPSQAPQKFTSEFEGKMGYEDFVYFMLSEEDKSSGPSLEYWYLLFVFTPLIFQNKYTEFCLFEVSWFLLYINFQLKWLLVNPFPYS